MPTLSLPSAQDEIERGAGALRKATRSAGWWFQPSGRPHRTATIRAAASRPGYQRSVSYDVDPRDYRAPRIGPGRVADTREGAARVVSLHLGHTGTVAALRQILAGLGQRRFRAERTTAISGFYLSGADVARVSSVFISHPARARTRARSRSRSRFSQPSTLTANPLTCQARLLLWR